MRPFSSIVFGGNFVKIIQDDENLPNTRTVHDFQSSVDFWKQVIFNFFLLRLNTFLAGNVRKTVSGKSRENGS